MSSAALKEVGSAGPIGTSRLVFPRLRGFYDSFEAIIYTALRLGFGLIMVTHGAPKILGIAHGSMADPMAGSMTMITNVLGLPFAPQLAMMIAVLEMVGGLMVAVGLLTRIIAPAIAIQMVVISYALSPAFAWIDRGIEYPLILGLIAAYISIRGGGPYSIDHIIGREV